VRADLTHWRGELAALEASGRRLWTQADTQPGDRVKIRGRLEVVRRANAKTVSIESGYSWVVKYRWTEVQDNPTAREREATAQDDHDQADDADTPQLPLGGDAACAPTRSALPS
jgi:hypothetical protein